MIDREHELPLVRQAELLKLSRGSLYYKNRPVTAAALAIMRRIDELHLDYPFAGSQAFRSALADANETPGSQVLRDLLRGEGVEIDFCLEAVEQALAKHGRPEIFNTGQGSQFTSTAFTGLLLENKIAISPVASLLCMDGRGAWRDNVFVEWVWRSVKYEEVYLQAYDSVAEARASIGRYLEVYNCKRPRSSLDGRTPDQAYFNHLPRAAVA